MTGDKHILITGSTIGRAMAESYADSPDIERVLYTWRRSEPVFHSPKIQTVQLDLTCEDAVAAVLGDIEKLDAVVNTVGLLHDDRLQPEKTIARFDPVNLARSIELNTLPTALLAKHTRTHLRQSKSSVFATISAKVGSIEDNQLGGWYSYRASKAALNMLIKTLSIEWQFALPNCAVAALHPGTVKSPLSAPYAGRGHATKTPAESAAHLKEIMQNLTPAQSGKFWSWDGSVIPW